jgi:hypothetical protein
MFDSPFWATRHDVANRRNLLHSNATIVWVGFDVDLFTGDQGLNVTLRLPLKSDLMLTGRAVKQLV